MGSASSYKEHLMDLLQDPKEAAAYLNVMLEEDDAEGFLLALRDVAEAHGGFTQLAKLTHLRRESLYRTLSRRGNPRLSSLRAVLAAVGLQVNIEVVGRKKRSSSRPSSGKTSRKGSSGRQPRAR